jgi:hypothetical protein
MYIQENKKLYIIIVPFSQFTVLKQYPAMMFALLLVVFLQLVATETVTFPYGTNGITYWTEPDCRGVSTTQYMIKQHTPQMWTNICVSRSFSLFHPLQGQEQLDISITKDPVSWSLSD